MPKFITHYMGKPVKIRKEGDFIEMQWNPAHGWSKHPEQMKNKLKLAEKKGIIKITMERKNKYGPLIYFEYDEDIEKKKKRIILDDLLPDKEMFPLPPIPKVLSDAMKKKVGDENGK